jgi:hypothetical protein
VIKGEATFSVTRKGDLRLLGVQQMETQRACTRAALNADTQPTRNRRSRPKMAQYSQSEATRAL